MAAKPDLIITATGVSMATFLKAAKATGLADKIPFYQLSAIDLSIIEPLGMDAPEGAYGGNPYLYYYPEIPANKAFAEQFKQTYAGFPPTMPLTVIRHRTAHREGVRKSRVLREREVRYRPRGGRGRHSCKEA
jgi:hypothetical protein